MARKVYTREFKLQALEMLTTKDLSIAEVPRKLGISEGCLRNWQATAKEKGEAAFPGHGKLSPAEDERTRLRAFFETASSSWEGQFADLRVGIVVRRQVDYDSATGFTAEHPCPFLLLGKKKNGQTMHGDGSPAFLTLLAAPAIR
jgi:transposase